MADGIQVRRVRIPIIEISCPICGAATQTLPRYPRRVCGTCAAKASNKSGRAPEFFFLLAVPLVCWPCSCLLASQRRQT